MLELGSGKCLFQVPDGQVCVCVPPVRAHRAMGEAVFKLQFVIHGISTAWVRRVLKDRVPAFLLAATQLWGKCVREGCGFLSAQYSCLHCFPLLPALQFSGTSVNALCSGSSASHLTGGWPWCWWSCAGMRELWHGAAVTSPGRTPTKWGSEAVSLWLSLPQGWLLFLISFKVSRSRDWDRESCMCVFVCMHNRVCLKKLFI